MGIYRDWLFGNPQVSTEEAARNRPTGGVYPGQVRAPQAVALIQKLSHAYINTRNDTHKQTLNKLKWVSLPKGNINSHMNTWTGLQCLIGRLQYIITLLYIYYLTVWYTFIVVIWHDIKMNLILSSWKQLMCLSTQRQNPSSSLHPLPKTENPAEHTEEDVAHPTKPQVCLSHHHASFCQQVLHLCHTGGQRTGSRWGPLFFVMRMLRELLVLKFLSCVSA